MAGSVEHNKESRENDPVPQLPLWKGTQEEIAAVLRDLDIAEELRYQRGEQREFEAILPPIIGEIPDGEERTFFSSIIPLGSKSLVGFANPGEEDKALVRRIREGMPQTIEIIEKHAEQFNDTRIALHRLRLERSLAEGGAVIGPFESPHCDPFGWLISDAEGAGTIFFAGHVLVDPLVPGFFGVSSPDRSSHASLIRVQAPPFAIIQKGPWTIHGSPIVHKKNRKNTYDSSIATMAIKAIVLQFKAKMCYYK